MKGDFTRRTFRIQHHYRGVLLQQGRVQLDADWNEQVDIQTHLDRTVTRDTIGTHGAPMRDAGFAITRPDGTRPSATAAADLRISAGNYYVDGILCENEQPVPLAAQPDLPGVALPAGDGRFGRYVVYLDVWSEHLTAVERPALREVALGGPDTATRARTIWQLRLAPVEAGTGCAEVAPPWAPPHSDSTGQLRARAKAPEDSPNPCVIPATAGYRRLENQLYRVEIHDDSDASKGATYVWSRDNGSVVARLVKIAGNTITIDAPARDQRLGFAKDQWVEVIDLARVRRGEHGYLGRLEDGEGTELIVAAWSGAAPTSADLTEPTVVRRWDSDGALPVTDDWVDLDEDGVQIQFQPGGVVRTGDFWLIPARTANLEGGRVDPDLAGDVEWPREADRTPIFQPREGVEHRFAVVALLDLARDGWSLASDCRRLFPPLTELIELGDAGGDGQAAMPGEGVPQPLEVFVANRTTPVPGARIQFTTLRDDDGADGQLAATQAGLPASTASTVEVATGPDGVAGCWWRPLADVDRPSQRVTARLLDEDGDPVGPPIHFTANLSIADQVWFDSGSCATLAGARTVQDALDRLAAARSLAAVGGDGQDGPPGADLPLPVEVQVRSDCGPVEGAQVQFSVESGAVAATAAELAAGRTTLEVSSDAHGMARSFWRLGDEPRVQVLTAAMPPDTTSTQVAPAQLAFTANLLPGKQLEPGLHVTDVVLVGGEISLRNDTSVESSQLIDGLRVVLDDLPDQATVDGKPVLTVTLDLPYPLASEDQQLFGIQGVVGTLPLTLAGEVALDTSLRQPAVVWTMSEAGRAFVGDPLFDVLGRVGVNRVLCHVTLTGRAIASSREADRLVVNGLALGRSREDGGTDLELPTVDDVRGADFTLWFWLVLSLTRLVVVPRRTELFRLKTFRDAMDLATSRDALRARLPGGVQVGDPRPTDLDAARRAADRAFRNGTERRMVLVADERYADAAAVIHDALGGIDVQVEVISAADPVAAARARIEAGDQLDGVLTDDASAPSVAELGGFSEVIPL